MSSFKMPYSNFHELNLDWMLEEFKKFIALMDEKIETFDDFQTAWVEFQNEINSTLETYEASIETYKNYINSHIADFESGINSDFNDFKTEMQTQYNDFIENYLETLGIVQTTGQSTTEVMSQKAVSDILDTHENRLDDIEEIDERFENRITIIEETIPIIEDDLNDAEDDIATLKADNLVNQSKINTLENNDAVTRARVTSLENRASNDEANIANLSGRVTSAENNISSLTARTASLENDNTSNKERITDLESDNTSNKERIADLESDNTSNKERITTLENNNLSFNEITDFIYNGENLTQKFASEIATFQNEWEWIKNRIRNNRFAGIHNGDYIPFRANEYNYQAQIGGINTYKDYGDMAVGNHIDFICRELWRTNKIINPVGYNNGLIPVETINGDGTTAEFTLTKEMNDIASVRQGDTELSDYIYDASTFKLTFNEAPAAGTITVTGTGTEYPWLASDLYHYLNSLAGQIPNSSGMNPDVKHVDYTADGVYYYLPAALKAVIVEKRAYLPKRYSASGLLSDDNAGGWENIGKLWLPSEWEVYGGPIRGGTRDYSVMGNCIQYPIFQSMANRVKKRGGSRASWWVLSDYSGGTTNWCYISNVGLANYGLTSNTYIAAPVCFRIS